MALPRFFQSTPKPDPNARDEKAELAKVDDEINNNRKLGPAFVSGSLFAIGLMISGMVKSTKVSGFLNLRQGLQTGSWDGTLVFVMGGGMLVSMASYQFVRGYALFDNRRALSCPLTQKKTTGKFGIPTNKIIDANLVLGSAIFGLGWGIGGLCPGPAIANAVYGYPNVLYRWWPSFFVGSFIAQKLKDFLASRGS